MHISDIAMQCANECTQLSRKVADRLIAERLARIAQRLLEAAHRETELAAERESAACACSADTTSK